MRCNVLFRLDAGGNTGLGHLRRCFALALSLKRMHVSVGFIARNPAFVRAWTENRFPVIPVRAKNVSAEIPELLRLISTASPDLLILDHYEFQPRHAAALRKKVKAIAYVDDMARWKKFPVDAVINHNIDAYRLPYPKKGPKLFLGTRYSLMGEEVIRLRNRKKDSGFNLFLTLGGGADPKDIGKLLDAFRIIQKSVPRAKAYLAPGLGWENNTHEKAVHWVDPKKFLHAMSRCHAAVSSSGVTSYELACLGIPAVLLTVADNQAGICKEMARRKCAIDGGWIQKASPQKIAGHVLEIYNRPALRKSLRLNQRKLVGITGPQRLARALQKEFLR